MFSTAQFRSYSALTLRRTLRGPCSPSLTARVRSQNLALIQGVWGELFSLSNKFTIDFEPDGTGKQAVQENKSQWKKGQSGNPLGYAIAEPRILKLRECSRAILAEVFEQKIRELLACGDAMVELRALQVLLDRAYGRAAEIVEINSKGAIEFRWRDARRETTTTHKADHPSDALDIIARVEKDGEGSGGGGEKEVASV